MLAWTDAAVWLPLLAALRAGPADLALRPERWETRAAVPRVEAVLKDPLSGPAAVDALDARLSSASSSADLLAAGYESLGVPAPVAYDAASAPAEGLPPALEKPVGELLAGLAAAKGKLDDALKGLSPEDRAAARAAVAAAVGDDGLSPARGTDFDAAMKLDLAKLADAGLSAARAVDAAIPALQRARGAAPSRFSARLDSPIGPVLVSAGDAEFDAGELAEAGLVVRLGGRTRYAGPAAVAGEGQVRVVVDLGGPVTVETSGPAAGSAEFGVGLFYALGSGPHEVKTGDYSLGAARFGTAYALVGGDAPKLSSGRFSQGAAAFGAAALETRGPGARVRAALAAQGYGTTRGAGLWRHRGDGLQASCGLELADPREPLGFLSLCQGAGVGPRAFASGGVGAAHLTGNRMSLEASYFAQGAGYWRGLGALFVRGDDAKLQSRRYGLGTGTHSAVGALDVKGDRLKVAAWGVGPGFGWDYGVGLFRLRGNKAKLRSDWASGRSDLGSRALVWLEGDGNDLALGGFATGSFTRAQAGYALAVVKGTGNRLKTPGLASATTGAFDLASTPWGLLHAEGDLTLDPGLALPDPLWPARDEGALAARAGAEKPRLAAALAPKKGDGPRERARRLLFAAAAQILDDKPAENAAKGLAALTDADAPALAGVLDPDRFDELTWARLGAAGLGPAAARAAAAEAKTAKGVRRAALLDWLRFGRAEESLPVLEESLRDADWRVRRQAASALGSLFDDEEGEEPGRRRFLRSSAAGASPERKRLSDFYAAAALAGPVDAALRLKLLGLAGSPFDAAARPAHDAFLAAVAADPRLKAALAKEDADCARLLPKARALLAAAAADPDDEVAAAALLSLGGAGDAQDAPLLAAALASPSAARREAAAAALAKLGAAAGTALEKAAASPDAATRALAAVAAGQTSDTKAVFSLLDRGLGDAAPSVRLSALAALGAAQTTTALARKFFVSDLRRMAASDPDASVRASATVMAAQIEPAK